MNVSKLPGSPVSTAALRSGRIVTGMYNKVMNFRAIDPKDPRAGLSAASVVDRQVWDQFYNSATQDLDSEAIASEFARLWPSDKCLEAESARPPPVLPGTTLHDLLDRWNKRKQFRDKGGKPKSYTSQTRRFERDDLVYEISLLRAAGKCEVPNCQHPVFETKAGEAFLEVHHINFLCAGGNDDPDNTAAICPAHHREAHFGKAADDLAAQMMSLRKAQM